MPLAKCNVCTLVFVWQGLPRARSARCPECGRYLIPTGSSIKWERRHVTGDDVGQARAARRAAAAGSAGARPDAAQ